MIGNHNLCDFLCVWLCWVFISMRAFSGCSEQGPLCSVWASHCRGFSRAVSMQAGFNSCSTPAQLPRGIWNLLRPRIESVLQQAVLNLWTTMVVLSDSYSLTVLGLGFMASICSVLINSLGAHLPFPKLPQILLLPCLWILYAFEVSKHRSCILFSGYSFIFTHIVTCIGFFITSSSLLFLSRIIFPLPTKSLHFYLIQMYWQWIKLYECYLVWKFLYFTGIVER